MVTVLLMTEPKILCVDDDINLLAGFHRSLQPQFEIVNALGGPAALKIMEEKGPFAVIMSDMRMPQMTGLEFLALAHERSPDSVQMILTGNADVRSAIEAMNSGRIFRYLEKPCPTELLVAALNAALDHYALNKKQAAALTETLPEDVRAELDSLNQQVSSSERQLLNHQAVQATASATIPVVDPTTGLPAAAEAEAALTSATGLGEVHVVVFALKQLHHARTRFGHGVVDQLFHFVAQSIANRLASPWAAQGLYRWHGDAVIILVQEPADLEEIKGEAKNLVALPLNFHCETRSRNAYIPVRMSATVISGTNPEPLASQIDQFVQIQRVQAS